MSVEVIKQNLLKNVSRSFSSDSISTANKAIVKAFDEIKDVIKELSNFKLRVNIDAAVPEAQKKRGRKPGIRKEPKVKLMSPEKRADLGAKIHLGHAINRWMKSHLKEITEMAQDPKFSTQDIRAKLCALANEEGHEDFKVALVESDTNVVKFLKKLNLVKN